ncbi:unnamed protein product [Phytomonas sp. Hart1]|nr:unnamed protein product [Phytomonas sp. Hart1]|eukprot:CCW67155.1 unnamed protein product [Phytomonas sp. isolate Hart1]
MQQLLLRGRRRVHLRRHPEQAAQAGQQHAQRGLAGGLLHALDHLLADLKSLFEQRMVRIGLGVGKETADVLVGAGDRELVLNLAFALDVLAGHGEDIGQGEVHRQGGVARTRQGVQVGVVVV